MRDRKHDVVLGLTFEKPIVSRAEKLAGASMQANIVAGRHWSRLLLGGEPGRPARELGRERHGSVRGTRRREHSRRQGGELRRKTRQYAAAIELRGLRPVEADQTDVSVAREESAEVVHHDARRDARGVEAAVALAGGEHVPYGD